MTVACTLCGWPTVPALDRVRDTRFGVPGTWTILRCRRCGLEQTHPVPTIDELIELYERHYNYGGESGTTYTNLRERLLMSPLYQFLLRIDGDVSFHGRRGSGWLLDIGCNEGRGLSLYARNGFTAEGLELNANAAAAARARGFGVHEVEIERFEPVEPYDIAVLSNVLEHSLDPRDMLRHVHRILKPGGEVWISLPNNRSFLRELFGRSWINWHVPFHITHFSSGCLRRLLAESGFTVIDERQVTPALWVAQTVIAWVFEGRPRQPALLRSAPLVAALMLAARGLFFPVLWAANRMGRGDCLVMRARRR